MRTTAPTGNNYTEHAGLFLSLLIHFIFIRFLILTFPTQPVAHKPILIFLGSILQRQDLAQFSVPARERTVPQADAIPAKEEQQKLHPSLLHSPLKIASKGEPRKDSKQFLKSTFLDESEQDIQARENSIAGLGIAPSGPAYTPLRLYPK